MGTDSEKQQGMKTQAAADGAQRQKREAELDRWARAVVRKFGPALVMLGRE